MKEEIKNYAFIDGQNLYLGTTKNNTTSWQIDLNRFRIYLEKKYKVTSAFYYLGYIQDTLAAQKLYENIQEAGFILIFRKHNESMISIKKGNVDSDIIFNIMKKLYKKEITGKIVLVSGDGDYKNLVDFLIEEKRFEKILFPNKTSRSSLYKQISNQYFANLDDKDTKNKIMLK